MEGRLGECVSQGDGPFRRSRGARPASCGLNGSNYVELASELGAIAYNRALFNEGKEQGITGESAIEWALATAQSAVALNP